MTLSSTDLLGRCVLDATQNQNESLNALVWPKHRHHGYKAVCYAVATAVCHFHKGSESRMKAMKRLSIPAGNNTKKACDAKDQQRMKSDLQASDKEKKQRQGMKLLHTRREDTLRNAEEVTYEAGAF